MWHVREECDLEAEMQVLQLRLSAQLINLHVVLCSIVFRMVFGRCLG